MKKRIGILAALLALIFSCKKSTPTDINPYAGYAEDYQNITLHNAVAMDPFYVAHRLDLYLNNGSPDTLRKELFNGASITTDDGLSYLIDFEPTAAPANDYLRYGQMIVHTHGQRLSETGAIWELAVDADSAYLMDMGGYGTIDVRIGPGGYTIEATANNAWAVRGEVDLGMVYSAQAANWNVDAAVTQVAGGQNGHMADLRFQVETSPVPGSNGGLTFDTRRYRYETLSPMLYMLSCNLGSRSGGEERIVRMDDYGYAGKDTIETDFGTQFVCDPSFTLSTRIDSVWTTMNF
jgi:hypothetical protein